MIDNLEDAIQHCKEKEEELKKQHSELLERPNFDRQIVADCWECARDHEQLAAWLEELRDRRNADRWISVQERLPEEGNWYLVTRTYTRSGHRSRKITDMAYYLASSKEFSREGVTHWKLLPKPYESEGEE